MTSENLRDKKERLVGELFIHVSFKIRYSAKKNDAVKRYMRSYLRALTLPELEFELKYVYVNGFISPTIAYYIEKASRGYDSWVARRRSKETKELPYYMEK
jgi:hypothetical protein